MDDESVSVPVTVRVSTDDGVTAFVDIERVGTLEAPTRGPGIGVVERDEVPVTQEPAMDHVMVIHGQAGDESPLRDTEAISLRTQPTVSLRTDGGLTMG
jgi:hypothetical protein